MDQSPYLIIRGPPPQLRSFVERVLAQVEESSAWWRDEAAEAERAEPDSNPVWSFVFVQEKGRGLTRLWMYQHHSGEYLSVSVITAEPLVPGPGLSNDERRRVLNAFDGLVRPIAVDLDLTVDREPVIP